MSRLMTVTDEFVCLAVEPHLRSLSLINDDEIVAYFSQNEDQTYLIEIHKETIGKKL